MLIKQSCMLIISQLPAPKPSQRHIFQLTHQSCSSSCTWLPQHIMHSSLTQFLLFSPAGLVHSPTYWTWREIHAPMTWKQWNQNILGCAQMSYTCVWSPFQWNHPEAYEIKINVMGEKLAKDATHETHLGLRMTSQSLIIAETGCRGEGTAFGLILPWHKNSSKPACLPERSHLQQKDNNLSAHLRVPLKIITEWTARGFARLTQLWAELIKNHSGKQICKHRVHPQQKAQ